MFIRPASFQPLFSREVEYKFDVFVPAPDGSTDVVFSDAPPAPLPDYNSQSIDALLKAGVPLERVNPHILGDARPSDDALIDAALSLKPRKSASTPVEASPTSVEASPTPVEAAPTDTL